MDFLIIIITRISEMTEHKMGQAMVMVYKYFLQRMKGFISHLIWEI